MIWIPAVLLFALFSMLLFATASNSPTIEEELVKWVEAEGGYWNPKLSFGKDENGLFGVFASQPIQANEGLAQVPWSCVVSSDSDTWETCDTVRSLSEYLKKNETLYAASLHEVARQHSSLLPAYWSNQGQRLLLKITDDGTLPPTDPFLQDDRWKHECEQVDKTATLLAMTHGESFGMIPLTDKFNSRAGNFTGAYFSMSNGEGDIALEIRAFRDLRAGEQVYTDYRQGYNQAGTPELFRDYGFVEYYPQRFIFPSHHIAFDVEMNASGDGYDITWNGMINDEEYNLVPSRDAMKFLQKELTRLRQVYSELRRLNEGGDVPKHELRALLTFCKSYVVAISHAIENANSAPWSRGRGRSSNRANQSSRFEF